MDTSFIGEPIDHDIPSPSIPLNHGFGLSSNDGGYHHQQTHNDKHIDILRPFKPQKDTGRGKGNVDIFHSQSKGQRLSDLMTELTMPDKLRNSNH